MTESEILCACGCGMEAPGKRSDGRFRRYRRGHKNGKYKGVREIINKPCDYCGKLCGIEKWRTEKFPYTYCSRSCSGKHRSELAKVTLICENCGEELYIKPSKKQCKHIYCSLKCFNEYRRKSPKNKMTVECSYCGASLKVWPYKAKKGKNFFCGRECRAKFIVGKGNPAYTNGNGRRTEYGPNWRRQRRKARKRDNDTCQVCGKKPKKPKGIHVHHIIPVYKFNGDWHNANKLSNLITLCIACHNKAELGKIPIQRKLI